MEARLRSLKKRLRQARAKEAANDAAAAGIWLEGAKDISITGNVFSGLTEKAVNVIAGDEDRVVFAANVLVEVASDLHGANATLQKTNGVVLDNQPKDGK